MFRKHLRHHETVALVHQESLRVESLHAMAAKAGQPPLPPWGNALAGATGAVLANALVYPLDM